MTNFCVNCKNFKANKSVLPGLEIQLGYCMLPQFQSIDLVTGETKSMQARVAREYADLCGPDAKLFEAAN